LRDKVLNDEKTRWKRIAAEVGKSEKGCKRMAKEMNLAV
jgi:hypothetical protein